ncbi:MAG: fibronectin type III domain-containing protein, partial [Myxococcota bacterium]|nr:fibronectin type III domain-containing protein [Myxococcota bacterium]
MYFRTVFVQRNVLILLGLATACRVSPDAPVDVTATVSEAIPTVVTVSWTTEETTRGQVEFGATDAYGQITPLEAEPSKTHSHLLLGLKADTEVHYRVVDQGGEITSDDGTVTTGYLPTDLRALT